MRIWSLHPKYLDSKGIVALWRESLLAKNVLLGNTKGYINHPQLVRFKRMNNPVIGINTYLHFVYLESLERGYSFNKQKIGDIDEGIRIEVSNGQIAYEFKHLMSKLELRDPDRYDLYIDEPNILPHPMFNIIDGNVEEWEKI